MNALKKYRRIRLYLLYRFYYKKLKKLGYVCDFRDNRCFVNRERKSRVVRTAIYNVRVRNDGINGCCNTCKFLDEYFGCTIKEICCSSAFCYYAYEKLSSSEKSRLKKIMRVLRKNNIRLNNYRVPKKMNEYLDESLKHIK